MAMLTARIITMFKPCTDRLSAHLWILNKCVKVEKRKSILLQKKTKSTGCMVSRNVLNFIREHKLMGLYESQSCMRRLLMTQRSTGAGASLSPPQWHLAFPGKLGESAFSSAAASVHFHFQISGSSAVSVRTVERPSGKFPPPGMFSCQGAVLVPTPRAPRHAADLGLLGGPPAL